MRRSMVRSHWPIVCVAAGLVAVAAVVLTNSTHRTDDLGLELLK